MTSVVLIRANENLCGICKKDTPPADTSWSSPTSEKAHKTCLETIQQIESSLWDTINEFLPNKSPLYTNLAHKKAITAVQNQIGKETSILEYLNEQGFGMLQSIFSSPEVLQGIESSTKANQLPFLFTS